MSLEAKGENHMEYQGFGIVPFLLYEEQRPNLPEGFDLPNGWRCLRTGSISGGTRRHPAEDWIAGPPQGPGRSVELSAIFVFDPQIGETVVIKVSKPDEFFRIRGTLINEKWRLVPSGLDRVVGYREI